jgi:hypothetical protein
VAELRYGKAPELAELEARIEDGLEKCLSLVVELRRLHEEVQR